MSWPGAVLRVLEFWRRKPRLRIGAEVRPDRVANTGWNSPAIYLPTLFLRIVNLSSEAVVVTHVRVQHGDGLASHEFPAMRLEPRALVEVDVEVGGSSPELALASASDAWLEDSTAKRHRLPNLAGLLGELERAVEAIEEGRCPM